MSWTPREIDAGFECSKCGGPLNETLISPDWRHDTRICGLCLDQIRAQEALEELKTELSRHQFDYCQGSPYCRLCRELEEQIDRNTLSIDERKAKACVDAFKPLVGAARANRAAADLFKPGWFVDAIMDQHIPANHRGDDIHTIGQFDCDCFEDLMDCCFDKGIPSPVHCGCKCHEL